MESYSDNKGINIAVESKIGGRKENQDSFGYALTPLGLLVVVCDGMGGGPAGKTASTIAVDAIINSVTSARSDANPTSVLEDAGNDADAAVRAAVSENPALNGMGTTCVCLLVTRKKAYIMHIGDSRCYQVRGGKSLFRTADHSYVGELVRRGVISEEEARNSNYSNVITRAIGTGTDSRPEVDEVSFKPGDRFALMTDGIWGSMPEPQLVVLLCSDETPEELVTDLSDRVDNIGVSEGGGHDNLTIAIVDIPLNPQPVKTINDSFAQQINNEVVANQKIGSAANESRKETSDNSTDSNKSDNVDKEEADVEYVLQEDEEPSDIKITQRPVKRATSPQSNVNSAPRVSDTVRQAVNKPVKQSVRQPNSRPAGKPVNPASKLSAPDRDRYNEENDAVIKKSKKSGKGIFLWILFFVLVAGGVFCGTYYFLTKNEQNQKSVVSRNISNTEGQSPENSGLGENTQLNNPVIDNQPNEAPSSNDNANNERRINDDNSAPRTGNNENPVNHSNDNAEELKQTAEIIKELKNQENTADNKVRNGQTTQNDNSAKELDEAKSQLNKLKTYNRPQKKGSKPDKTNIKQLENERLAIIKEVLEHLEKASKNSNASKAKMIKEIITTIQDAENSKRLKGVDAKSFETSGGGLKLINQLINKIDQAKKTN